MNIKPILVESTREELAAALAGLGQPAFRVKQLYTAAMQGKILSAMSNLPLSLREDLSRLYEDRPVEIRQAFPSQKDDTVKFLYALRDGNLIEGVLMHYHYGYSLCISTQVGCRMGCAFCASTLNGCVRSLSPGEMFWEVQLANQFLGEKGKVGHIVLMGSGEPLDNYENVMRFLQLIHQEEGLNISLRNVSLSTCGLVDQIDRLSKEGLGITLSISLHAPNDGIRRQIMPIAKRWPMEQLLEAVRRYVAVTGRRAVFEYAMIAGLNAAPEHARELASRLRGLQCHVNLIPLNHVKESPLEPAGKQEVAAFLKTLENLHISATIRREMGADIGGACGQLRRSYLNQEA